jgi:hypothetical protein
LISIIRAKNDKATSVSTIFNEAIPTATGLEETPATKKIEVPSEGEKQ